MLPQERTERLGPADAGQLAYKSACTAEDLLLLSGLAGANLVVHVSGPPVLLL